MKERNLWSVEYIQECLVGDNRLHIYVSTKTDYEPEALDIIREIIDNQMGSEWSFKEFTKVERLSEVYSIKKK